MSDFLQAMAQHSHERVLEALRNESEAALQERAEAVEPPPTLAEAASRPASAAFDLIAEVKLRSPAAGRLADNHDAAAALPARALSYAAGGAAAVSVLTEPSRFDGSLQHLADVAAALKPAGVPAMRKDFLVSPYQLLEARAAGAGGVLLIAAMLDDAVLAELLALARSLGLFVLLEAFDAEELTRCGRLLDSASHGTVLVGLNSRDLRTLEVDAGRFAALKDGFPGGVVRVAESGVGDAADAAEVATMGYHCALVGSALMTSNDPQQTVQQMLHAGREAAALRGAT
ncbi:MAG: indole-3-glycerol phosphate synthase TrpC [Pseudomonadota bacterium]